MPDLLAAFFNAIPAPDGRLMAAFSFKHHFTPRDTLAKIYGSPLEGNKPPACAMESASSRGTSEAFTVRATELPKFFQGFSPKVIPSSQVTLHTANGLGGVGPAYLVSATGGYADIYKGTMEREGGSRTTVAVKVFRGAHLITNGEEGRGLYVNRLRQEYAVWGELKHCNVLPLQGILVCDALPSPGLVSEYKEHGNILDLIKMGTEFDRLSMGKGIACGLQYLHARGVMHGDLTPANILVDVDKEERQYIPLITDFGKSRLHPEYTANVNTSAMEDSPSTLSHPDPGSAMDDAGLFFASDVYSFSFLLLQLLTNKPPFKQEGTPTSRLISKMIDEQNAFRPTPDTFPLLDKSHSFCWPIMEACWNQNPGDRITSREAYERLCKGPL